MAEQKIDLVYIEITQPQADANYGKLMPGQVLAVSSELASRFIKIGVAEESSKAAYDKQREKHEKRVEARNSRAGEFAALNLEAGAAWDTSTSRDVTMAPDEGIRRAFEQGRLVNTQLLTDKDGNPLPQDVGLEEILEARTRLGSNRADLLTDHTRSSVSGGGSSVHPVQTPYVEQVGSTLGDTQPLNQPTHKLSPEQLGNAPAKDDDESDEASSRRGRARK